MRVLVLLLLLPIAGVGLLPSASSQDGRIGDNLQWGPPVDGIQISLSSSNPKLSELQVAVRNVGDHDVTLNLGMMMANGKFQLPDRINIEFKDGLGKTRVFKFGDLKHAFVAGRLDDYVVPLRSGSMYTLTVTLDQFWCQETKEFTIPLTPGKNSLTAHFEGKGAQRVNEEMSAIPLMNFWLSKVDSNTLILER
jgi:hypothetical protein